MSDIMVRKDESMFKCDICNMVFISTPTSWCGCRHSQAKEMSKLKAHLKEVREIMKRYADSPLVISGDAGNWITGSNVQVTFAGHIVWFNESASESISDVTKDIREWLNKNKEEK